MRFEQPSYAQEVHERQAADGCCAGDVEDGPGPPFCIPADGVHCRGCKWDADRGLCFRNDCDALFTPPALRQQQREWAAAAAAAAGTEVAPILERPQVVITAGPERSGSTWLFNAVRLLLQHARQPLDSYWVKDLTDAALDARRAGVRGSHHVLVKTHAWSDAFDQGRATHVFVTHRDLRQVLASWRRMTWEYEIPDSFVEDHFKWKAIAELDIAFEDIIGRPREMLAELAARLGLQGVDLSAVLADVSNLPVPTDWVDPITQIWPSHISPEYEEARKRAAAASTGKGASPAAQPGGTSSPGDGDGAEGEFLGQAMDAGMQPETPTVRSGSQLVGREDAESLLQRFPHFFSQYGYA